MKCVVGALIMFVSVQLSAFDGEGYDFKGKGTWTKMDGVTGSYEIRTYGEVHGDGVHVTETYTVDGKVETVTFCLHNKPFGFFDVVKKQGEEKVKVGEGYCTKELLKSICHYDFTTPEGAKGEVTLKVSKLRLERVGSLRMGDDAARFEDHSHRSLIQR